MMLVMAVLGIMALILLMPNVLTAVEDTQTAEQSDTFSVTTGGGVTNSDVTLSQDLWENNTQFVEDVTSDAAADNPIANTYTAATNVLNVTGLAASTTRNLTAAYLIDQLDEYQGIGSFASIVPFLLLFIVVGLGLAVLWRAFKR